MKNETEFLKRRKKIGVHEVSFAFLSLSRSGMRRLSRFMRRGSWLSYQYFELGSLINLYLKALEAKDNARIELFIHTALRVLHGYKASIYRRFKRTISQGRKTAPSPVSLHGAETLHGAAAAVYEELRTVARRYGRRRRRKQIFDDAASLIREVLGR